MVLVNEDTKSKKINPDKILGAALLLLFFVVGLLTIYSRPFVDEADNLVTGWMISQGKILYKDIFSHHFPLPYYTVAFLVSIFGKSLFIIRVSILIFQSLCFFTSMLFYRKWIPIGLTAITWSIFRLFYRGNVFLYSSISGPALFCLFIICFSIINNNHFSKSALLVITVLSGIALFSDPLSIYPILIVYLLLFLKDFKKGVISISLLGGITSLYVLYLLLSKSFSDFLTNAIYFNSFIYDKYTPASPFRFSTIIENLITGLNIFNSAWLNFNPFYSLTFTSLGFDSWAFTGFFYRGIIIIGVILLILNRKYLLAAFTYIYSASIMSISPWEFRAQGFVLVCLFVTFIIISGHIKPKLVNHFQTIVYYTLRVLIISIVAWVIYRSLIFIYPNRTSLTYHNSFGNYELSSTYFQELTCNQNDVYLLNYPGGLYSNWFSELKPFSKYAFMWPWVAEIALPELENELSIPGTLAIIHIEDAVIWGLYDTRDYLMPLTTYLEKNYSKVDNNTYISPALAEECIN